MKTEINMGPTARHSLRWFGLLLALLVLSPLGESTADEVPKRHALVYMSDGTESERTPQFPPPPHITIPNRPGGGMKKRGRWISTTSERSRGFSHSILMSSKK
jgi:hypothetical protein